MPPSRERLGVWSAETGFRAETLEKVVRLGEVLADVSRHPLLSRVLLLKGGTALNLGFGPPARLSIDLDFNYVGAEDRNAMLAERPEVERALEVVAVGSGYRLQRSGDEFAVRKLFLGYRNAFGTGSRSMSATCIAFPSWSPQRRRSGSPAQARVHASAWSGPQSSSAGRSAHSSTG